MTVLLVLLVVAIFLSVDALFFKPAQEPIRLPMRTQYALAQDGGLPYNSKTFTEDFLKLRGFEPNERMVSLLTDYKHLTEEKCPLKKAVVKK